MSRQNYIDKYTNTKILKGRRECVFWGKVSKTDYCLGEISKPFNFNSVKRRLPQYIKKITALC